jgi:carbamoyl-phosphate synthase small subunit
VERVVRRIDPPPAQKLHVVALDFGAKRNILRACRLRLQRDGRPRATSASDILAKNPDGIFLSNGPGDPAAVTYAANTIRELLGKKPIFGICLGHQLLALALGAKTYKLKFGHRGLNQPVKDLTTGRVEITTQNHGFVVDVDSIKNVAKTTHLHLNDGTSEGLEAPTPKRSACSTTPKPPPVRTTHCIYSIASFSRCRRAEALLRRARFRSSHRRTATVPAWCQPAPVSPVRLVPSRGSRRS